MLVSNRKTDILTQPPCYVQLTSRGYPHFNLTQSESCISWAGYKQVPAIPIDGHLKWRLLRHTDPSYYLSIGTVAMKGISKVDVDILQSFWAAVIAIVELDSCHPSLST